LAKQALGRGLKALIPDTPKARSGLAEIPIDLLRPNPEQPRRSFDADRIAELAESIRRHGVLQPLLVSEHADGGYLVVAGERRWRAARAAGLATVPAVIRERLGPRDELALALVENLQRRDLSPLEEARAFEHLRSEHGLSQLEIAEQIGRDRSTVANALRLLKLPEEIQELVESERLSAGHARALLGLADEAARLEWADRAVRDGMSVRELERVVATARDANEAGRRTRKPPAKDPNLIAAEEQLSLHLGARVEIRPRAAGGGTVLIRCDDHDDLLGLFDRLMGGA
jgi:ParB family chromosome partitioning protein